MKRLTVSAIIISIAVFSGCAALNNFDFLSRNSEAPKERIILTEDITQDGAAETVSLVDTNITIADEFTETYPEVFKALYVRRSDSSELLRVDRKGIKSENNQTVPALIENRAAFALQLDRAENGLHIIIVQIDSAGQPVSEPITISWDAERQGWNLE